MATCGSRNGHDTVADSAITYAYDANGSTKTVTTDPAGAPPATSVNYKWDLRNRMSGYDANGDNDFADNGDVLFGYDHEGTRVHKEELGGDEIFYLQDKNNPTKK